MAVSTAPRSTVETRGLAHGSGGPRPVPGTLTQLFFDAIARHDKPNALGWKSDGRWHSMSHRDLVPMVRRAALGLQAIGGRAGDRVAILSENRWEWFVADFGCLTSAMADVPIYPTLPAEQMVHILNDSGASVVFVSDAVQAAKIAQIRPDCPGVRTVVSFADPAPAGVDLTLAQLLAQGAMLDTPDRAAAWEATARAVQPDDLATLIYTSGTTGLPKGVMLSHDNIFSNVAASLPILGARGDDTCLSFLPLSHIFERMAGHYMMFAAGVSICYAESIDAVPANLLEVRPTLLCSVPRIYEKMYARIMENGAAATGLKRAIFFWAIGVADTVAGEKLAGRTPGGLLGLQYALADRLVFSKVRERTGGRLRMAVSGGAPLSPAINKFFIAIGLNVCEGYGLTETSPVIAVNRPHAIRIGTVGQLIGGVEVLIAEDGEILTRGPHVMHGYYHNEAATREAITPDGWFHTGDIGELSPDGFLKITDRKKDIIVTAGGKNLAPQPIENAVKTNKYVTQAVMIGDKRKFPIMLIVPNWDNVAKWCGYKGIPTDNRTALLTHPLVLAKMQKEVGKSFTGLASYETPKKIGLLEHEFTIERGELTPKLSVKRRVVDKLYADVIDRLYAEEAG
ncbi:MAG: long-chain fatty acid--CoA ligase [Gemmatimonadaceae bacterium]|nr:long-chain fatty acid--CoA ligase [Gemmatimonadaceae bacterium]